MLKKLIVVISATLTLVMPAISFAVNFSDVPADSNYELPIHFLRSRGIVTGYPDNTYRPQQVLTRGVAARVILSAYQNSPIYHLNVPDLDPASTFPDMNVTDPFAKYLVKATQLGIMSTDANGNYNPQQSMTRAEFMKLLIYPSGIDISSYQTQKLYDDVFINSWYTQYMNFAGINGLILPDQENKLYPSQIVSRGEAAEMGYALLLIVRKDETVTLLNQLRAHIDKAFYFMDRQNLLSAKRNAGFAVGIGQALYDTDATNTEYVAHAKLAKAVSYTINYWLIHDYIGAEVYRDHWHALAQLKLDEALQLSPTVNIQAAQLLNYF